MNKLVKDSRFKVNQCRCRNVVVNSVVAGDRTADRSVGLNSYTIAISSLSSWSRQVHFDRTGACVGFDYAYLNYDMQMKISRAVKINISRRMIEFDLKGSRVLQPVLYNIPS